MPATSIPTDVEFALRDLHTRTLAKLKGDFARLIYLASTRNYNSGHYEHDGLSFRFAQPAAEMALDIAHREIFLSLALSPLPLLVQELEQYVFSGCEQPDELLSTWKDLQAYRVLPPAHDDPLTVSLFLSNVKVALALVEPTWRNRSNQRSASRLPSPGQ